MQNFIYMYFNILAISYVLLYFQFICQNNSLITSNPFVRFNQQQLLQQSDADLGQRSLLCKQKCLFSCPFTIVCINISVSGILMGIKFFRYFLRLLFDFVVLSFQDGVQYGCQKQENATTVDKCTSNLPSSKNLHTPPCHIVIDQFC